jgi:hypothetical protein
MQDETQPLKLPNELIEALSSDSKPNSADASLRARTALCHAALNAFVANPNFAKDPTSQSNHPLLSYGGGLVHRLGFEPHANLELFTQVAELAGRANWLSRGANEFQDQVEELCKQLKAYDGDAEPLRTPPITLVAIPKSAGTFLAWILRSGLNAGSRVVTTDYFPGANIQPEFLRDFALNGNGVSHNHLDPTRLNSWYLAESKISVVVQMRDLRAVVLSWVHHLRVEEPRFRSDPYYNWKFPYCRIDAAYFDQALEWQIDYLIDNFLPILIDWSSGWADVQKSGRVRMLMTNFEDMLHDERGFINKILDFYNVPHESFVWQDYTRDEIPRFRVGALDEWRSSMSAAQQRRVGDAIPAALFEQFGWQE